MKSKKKIILSLMIILAIIVSSVFTINILRKNNAEEDVEILRSRKYEQVVSGDEKIDNTDYVTFDAYYLRDLDGDGYAEKLRGTCRKVGAEDTLYLDLNVLTNGTLKDAKITIDGKNFYFSTAIVKDTVISQDYISTNTKEIALNDVVSGTQKLIFGSVKSGDYTYTSRKLFAIGNNINKYSVTDNSITLTGTHVADDGTETQISKTVYLTNDWYGTTKTELYMPSYIKNQEYDIATALDETNQKLIIKFKLNPTEKNNELLIYKNHIEAELPLINGYAPTKVTVSNADNATYDESTRIFTAEKVAATDDTGAVTTSVARDITYEVEVEYPLEAYTTLGADAIAVNIPLKSYYEGYNNTSSEFVNPYKSNVAEGVISVVYKNPDGDEARVDVKVGHYVWDEKSDSSRYVVSKELPMNIYNQVETEATQADEYTVGWYTYTGSEAENVPLILKETPENYTDQFLDADGIYVDMEKYISNTGIYFTNPNGLLGDEGYINVYNDETNELLHTFTNADWLTYSSENPYKYETPVKHIRVETSPVSKNTYFYVHNIKEIDDVLLTAEYTEAEFGNLSKMYSYVTGYMDIDGVETKLSNDINFANYEIPYSVATISINPDYVSNQETKKGVNIKVNTETKRYNTKKWLNGEFLIKYPAEIIDVNINSVTSTDSAITVTGVDTYEENGNIYTKIYTSNTVEKNVSLNINADLTADPRIITATKNIELYYYNSACHNYDEDERAADSYDINGDENTEEYVGYTNTSLSVVAPSNLLTSQIATDFDDAGSIAIAPQEATIDKVDGTQTAKVNVNIANNYSSTISELKIVGKIPFEGNTYQLNGVDLDSKYSTTMTQEGITVPENLKDSVTVYYSEEENVTEDISAKKNGWTTTPEDMTKIKSYLIDLGSYVMPTDSTETFSYTIQIPAGLDYNDVAYSAHAVYYCLDTDEGKLKTQTEPNKLGFLISEKYDLEITKYETNSTDTVPKVVFSAQEVGTQEVKTATTYSSGIATLKNLYVEREYIIKEIKTNKNYILDTTETKIIGHIVDGELQIEILEGGFKETPVTEIIENANRKAKVSLENEVKYSFVLNKTLTGTDEAIQGIRFELTDYNGATKKYTTNSQGKLTIKLLEPNKQYTLTEIDSKGHYLKDPVTFMMVRDENNNLKFSVLSGDLDSLPTIDETGEVPVVTAGLSNEEIPTYSLKITKKETDTETIIPGAQFKVIGEDKEEGILYTTDENGTVQIDNLYQYVEEKDLTAEYTLQEVYPTEGYILNETPIVFKAQKDATDSLKLEIISGTIREAIEDVQVDNTDPDNPIINITIDNAPIFTLTKVDSITKEPLEGVEFEITDADGNKVADTNGNAIDKVYTDSNGKIRLGLPQGLYKLVETKALEGYVESSDTHHFGIAESKEGKYSFGCVWENSDKAGIEIDYMDIAAINDGVFAMGYAGELVKYDFDGNLIIDKESIGYARYRAILGAGDRIYTGMRFTMAEFDSEGNNTLVFSMSADNEAFYDMVLVDDGAAIVGVTDGYFIDKYDMEKNLTYLQVSYRFRGITSAEDAIIAVARGGQVVKYDTDLNMIWENTEKTYYYVATTTVDNGIVAVSNAGQVVKYDFDGNVVWENTEKTYTYSDVTTVSDGVIVVGTSGEVVKYDLDGNIVLENTEKTYNYKGVTTAPDGGVVAASYTGEVVKYGYITVEPEIPAEQSLTIENDRREHKITTEVDGDGGTISGQDDNPYEVVIYGEDSQKDIIVTPDEGYKVIEITVNGEKVSYIANDDGTVELEKFTNITSDKHIVAKFSNTSSDVIAHHYILDTTTQVAEDKVLYGNVGDIYVTSPKIGVEGYTLAQNEDGSYQIPDNATGTFTEETQVVTYYYEETPQQVIVHHYVDGTEDSVADDEIIEGSQGDAYTTNPVEYPTLDEKYELVTNKLPENASGTFENAVTEVTYYYKIKEFNVTASVEGTGGTISNNNGTVLYGESTAEDIVITPNIGYKISKIIVNDVEQTLPEDKTQSYTLPAITNITEDKNIVVTFELIKENITVYKVWDDSLNTSTRPTNIVVELYSGSNLVATQTLNEENTDTATVTIPSTGAQVTDAWKYTFENMPMYDESGNTLSYNVVEKEANTNELHMYSNKVESIDSNNFVIINTFTIPEDKIDITVTKNWSDNTNANSRRPSQIKLQVKNGDTVVQEQVLDVTTGNTQTHTFTDLPVYDDKGNELSYTVDEVEVNTDDLKFYSKAVDNTTYTITNTFTVPEDKVDVDVTKKWVDNSNANGVRPTQITLKVKNGDTVVQEKTVDVTENNEEVYTFENLAKYDENGQEIVYTVDEEDITGYTKTIEGTTITNTINTYKITTQVNGEGGTISGQTDNPYEEVSYNGTSTKDIVITPNTGYEISKITINNVEQTLPTDLKVAYTLNKFANVTEDKNVVVEFKKIEYKITAKVNGEGGTISESEEIVKYGEDSIKNIVITPTYGYEISSITINGENHDFTPNGDGTYTLPKFANVTENKEVVVTFEYCETSVLVKYVTEDGTELSESVTINGKVNDNYATEALVFSNYDLKETPANATGTMTKEQIIVTYEYTLVKGKITITKVDNTDNTKLLSGATFKLERLNDEGNVDTTFAAVEKTTGNTGTVEFDELLVGNYQVTETVAPEGYQLATNSVDVQISKLTREQDLVIKNKAKIELPKTGSVNYTIIASVIGVSLIIVALGIKKLKKD